MPYSPKDYLLDRFAVEDAARAIWLAVDTHDWSRFPALIHSKGLLLDYSKVRLPSLVPSSRWSSRMPVKHIRLTVLLLHSGAHP